jgi:hypothetical protein
MAMKEGYNLSRVLLVVEKDSASYKTNDNKRNQNSGCDCASIAS